MRVLGISRLSSKSPEIPPIGYPLKRKNRACPRIIISAGRAGSFFCFPTGKLFIILGKVRRKRNGHGHSPAFHASHPVLNLLLYERKCCIEF